MSAERRTPPRGPSRFASIFLIRNASELPIEVVQLACDLETTWLVPDGEIAYRPVAGVQPHRSFTDHIVVPPQDTWDSSHEFNIAHLAPENAVQLSLIRGAVVVNGSSLLTTPGGDGRYGPPAGGAQDGSDRIADGWSINRRGGQLDERSSPDGGTSRSSPRLERNRCPVTVSGTGPILTMDRQPSAVLTRLLAGRTAP